MQSDVFILNLLGYHCPIPVRETRSALRQLSEGARLQVTADDPETLRDIPTLIERLGITLLNIEKSAGEYTFHILKSPPESEDS